MTTKNDPGFTSGEYKMPQNSNEKRIPLWAYILGFVVFALLASLFIAKSAQAQPYRFESKAALQSVTYVSGVLTIKVAIPAAEASMIQKMLGKATTTETINQIGQEAASDVKRLSGSMYNKQRDDARDYIPQTEIDKALDARSAHEKRLADSTEAAKTQGAIIDRAVDRAASIADRGIGKRAFSQAWSEQWQGEPARTNSPTFGGMAEALILPIIGIIILVAVAIAVF